MKHLKGAFTLIETLISLAILGIGLVFLFNLFPMGWAALAYSRKLNEASILAQKKLEELKSQETTELGTKSGKEGDLSWNISVSPLKSAEGLEVILVELDIDYTFQSRQEKQRFITYVAKNQ